MTDKTFTRAQVYAFAIWLARQAEQQDRTARELAGKRKVGDSQRHYGEAKAFQAAAMYLKDVANGAYIEGITNQDNADALPKLAADGRLLNGRDTEAGAHAEATSLYGSNLNRVIAFIEGWRYAQDPRFQGDPQDGTSASGRASAQADEVFPGWANNDLRASFYKGWLFATGRG